MLASLGLVLDRAAADANDARCVAACDGQCGN